VDMLSSISRLQESEAATWFEAHEDEIRTLVANMAATGDSKASETDKPAGTGKAVQKQRAAKKTKPAESGNKAKKADSEEPKDRVLRLSSEHLDRMLALASEMQVEWQWLEPFSASMLNLKRRLAELEKMLINIEFSADDDGLPCGGVRIEAVRSKAEQCRDMLAAQQEGLELHIRSVSTLSHRLYHQTVASRMRPFADGVPGFKRMVRDLARDMGKKVRLEISGLDTAVDRDILEKIESPLNHLIRNAIDHGLEEPEERRNLGKPEEGLIQLEAIHQSGMLRISVSDDGRGLLDVSCPC